MSTGSNLLSRPEVRLTPELVEEYRTMGAWRDVALGGYLSEATRRNPDGVAAVSVSGETGEETRAVTYAGLHGLADGLSCGLAGLGIGAGDAVSILMPNRLEFEALLFGILRLGAVYSGIPINYGPREAAFMLRRARSKVLVVPAPTADATSWRWRGTCGKPRQNWSMSSYSATRAPRSRAGSPSTSWRTRSPSGTPTEVDPSSLAHIGFTSGTTGEPKAS
jgi:cyclohexanecarboxylate-CoA ligase